MILTLNQSIQRNFLRVINGLSQRSRPSAIKMTARRKMVQSKHGERAMKTGH